MKPRILAVVLIAAALVPAAFGQGCEQSRLPPWKVPFCEARTLFFAGRFADAEPLFRRAWEISLLHAEPSPGLPPDFTARNYQGLCLQYQDRLLEALDIYDDVVAMQAARDPELIYPESRADALNNAGWLLYLMGRYEEARDRLDRALALAPPRGTTPALWLRGRILTSRGAVYGALGDHSQARRLLTEATTNPVGREDFMNQTRAHGLLGRMDEAWGRHPEARRHYQQAIAAFDAAGPARPYNVAQLVEILGRLGRLEARLGRKRLASRHFQRALEIARRLGSRALLARALLDGARAHTDSGESALALGLLTEAATVATASGQLVLLGDVHLERGALHLARGDLDDAVQDLHRVVSGEALPALPEDAARAHGLLAQAWQAKGELARARAGDLAAIEALDRVRIALLPEADRWRIRAQFRRIHAAALARLAAPAVAGDLAAIETAFDIAERTRARSLAEDVALADLAPQSRVQLREQARWEERVLALAREIDAQGRDEIPAERRAAHRSAIEEWERVRRRQQETTDRLHVPARRLRELRPLVAPPGHGVLAYFVDEARSYAWLVTSSRLRMVSLPGRATLEGLVASALKEWQDGRADAASALSAIVLEPFAADLGSVEGLTVVGSGPLHRVPFDALRWSRERSHPARYLLETHSVSHVPSLSLVPLLNERAERRRGSQGGAPVLAYGVTRAVALPVGWSGDSGRPAALPPLAFTRDEVATIVSALGPDRVRTRTGPDATEAAFRAEPLETFQIIHIAAHGWIDARETSRTALALGSSSTRDPMDGMLTVPEIAGLPLGADLVVLSGCDTGSGRVLSGEGTIGLGRAFLQAGSSTVLVGLWGTPDASTSRLMKEFYRWLARGQTPARALRMAKLDSVRALKGPGSDAAWAQLSLLGLDGPLATFMGTK